MPNNLNLPLKELEEKQTEPRLAEEIE